MSSPFPHRPAHKTLLPTSTKKPRVTISPQKVSHDVALRVRTAYTHIWKADEALPADATEAKLSSDDVKTAGEQATTAVNPPDGDGTAEADLEGAANNVNGTSGKGKRKSSAGVPEHKTKKLNKKKSSAQLNLDIQPGDYVWARLKGYPPWPAIACDEAMLPESLLGTRPVSTKRPDGSYREDFDAGGKNVRDRTYPVMFLATNELYVKLAVKHGYPRLTTSQCLDDQRRLDEARV